jgi:uncharacterized protein (TIGR00297 family)
MQPETARKLVHMGFGLCALLLKWLSPWQAALLALAAFLFNAFVLPHVGGKTIARDRRGHDTGILLYPLAVLALILVFPGRLDIAGTVWMIMAFGDGAATLLGRLIGRRPLPWNPDKTWIGFFAFIEVAILPAYLTSLFLRAEPDALPRFVIIGLTVIICAVAESLRTGIDDNIVVPFAGCVTMYALGAVNSLAFPQLDRLGWIWLAVNSVLALIGYAARGVTFGGLVGGWILGAVLIVFGGWPLYAVLLAFFTIGTLATKLGYHRKASLGLAQEGGGRRGFRHAFANVGLAALIALLIGTTEFSPALLFFMAASALATAAADTAGSEIGQLLGKRAFLPLSFRRVDRGTEGAVSIEGTLAGLGAAILVALVAVLLQHYRASARLLLIGVVAGSGFIGSYLESVLGSWNRRRAIPIPNDVMNFVNTIFGAAVCALLWKLFDI